jgi:hypothetical protein
LVDLSTLPGYKRVDQQADCQNEKQESELTGCQHWSRYTQKDRNAHQGQAPQTNVPCFF